MEHKWISSERGTVHYWISRNPGKGERCIVFTHGLTADHTMFEKQVDFFSGQYTVITWDVPLHGESRPYKDFSYKNSAADLKEILDTEDISRVILVGMSMGGYPCQEFAVQYPDRVIAFIAVDTTPFGLDYYSRSDRWWLGRVGSMAKWFPEKLLKKSMARSVSKTQYAYELMMKMLESSSKADIVEQMEIAYGGFLKENKNVRFTFPVLILLGQYDRTGKVSQYCKAWAKKEGYPLRIIRNAAHFSNADNYVDVNNEINEFIRSLRRNVK